MKIPSHHATTAHLGAIFPFFSENHTLANRVVIGSNLFGGTFCFDPFEIYANGVISNPNMVVFGQIGMGKSSFVKTYILRQSIFGRKAWIIDPKGEYSQLALALNCRPIVLRPNGSIKLNPLELGTSDLLVALVESGMKRGLRPIERAGLDIALSIAKAKAKDANLDYATLPNVLDELLDPSESFSKSLFIDQKDLKGEIKEIALELLRMVSGDLRGMFDGPTSKGITPKARCVVIDLSNLYSSHSLSAVMACATSWLQSEMIEREPDGGLFMVIDEAWAVLEDIGVSKWLQKSFKLARSYGVSNIAVMHRFSDLLSGGELGSLQEKLGEGLLKDSETKVIFAQPTSEIDSAKNAFGLSETEAALIHQLTRARSLWKVGNRSYLVDNFLTGYEARLVNTDAAMHSSSLIANAFSVTPG